MIGGWIGGRVGPSVSGRYRFRCPWGLLSVRAGGRADSGRSVSGGADYMGATVRRLAGGKDCRTAADRFHGGNYSGGLPRGRDSRAGPAGLRISVAHPRQLSRGRLSFRGGPRISVAHSGQHCFGGPVRIGGASGLPRAASRGLGGWGRVGRASGGLGGPLAASHGLGGHLAQLLGGPRASDGGPLTGDLDGGHT